MIMDLMILEFGNTKVPILYRNNGHWMALTNTMYDDFDAIIQLKKINDAVEAYVMLCILMKDVVEPAEITTDSLQNIKGLTLRADPAFALFGRHIPEYAFAVNCGLELRKRLKSVSIKSRSGAVYLLHAENGYYKIGKSSQPKKRIASIKGSMPLEVTLIHMIKTEEYGDLEKKLHELFSEKRVNGEWFALEPADVEYIKGLIA